MSDPARPACFRIATIVDGLTCASFARRVALEAGFDPDAAAEIGTCASELATNVARHGGGGTLEVLSDRHGIVLHASDRGRGTERELQARISRIRKEPDHPSALHGLGVLVRWMDQVEVIDVEGGGLEIRARRALPPPDRRR
jgi:anti-sigma regulatory factor (Ser/Thr protein kinase)